MGIVQRQGIQNAIYTYSGVILGWLNKTILFTQFLTTAQYGLVELLTTFMVLGSELSQLGISKVILRFFPYFHERKDKEGKFIFFVTAYGAAGFLLVCLILLLIQPIIINHYQANSPLFTDHYFYIFPLILSYTSYRILTTLSQSLLKTVVPSIAYNVGLRLGQTIAILIYYYQLIDFQGFMILLTLSFFLPSFLILAYILWLNKLRIEVSFSWFQARLGKIMLNYGWYSSLGEMTNMMVSKVDLLMIGWLIGESSVAIYALATYITMLIQMPARSIRAIAVPLIAKHMRFRQFEEIQELYQKTAITNLVVAALVMIGLWVNIDSFFEFLPKYAGGRNVVILLGFGSIFNIITGLHRPIIINSRFFRFDLYLNILLLILVSLTNYLIIPIYGLDGAAIATVGSLLLYNGIGCIYVWVKFRMQPFTKKTALNIVVAIVVLVIGLNIPKTGSPLLDIVIRSVIVTAIYGPLVLWLKISPDINNMVSGMFSRITGGQKKSS